MEWFPLIHNYIVAKEYFQKKMRIKFLKFGSIFHIQKDENNVNFKHQVALIY